MVVTYIFFSKLCFSIKNNFTFFTFIYKVYIHIYLSTTFLRTKFPTMYANKIICMQNLNAIKIIRLYNLKRRMLRIDSFIKKSRSSFWSLLKSTFQLQRLNIETISNTINVYWFIKLFVLFFHFFNYYQMSDFRKRAQLSIKTLAFRKSFRLSDGHRGNWWHWRERGRSRTEVQLVQIVIGFVVLEVLLCV